MLLNIILATVAVGIISFIGILVIYDKQSKKLIKTVIALAAGALLGATFFGIIPELFSAHHDESGFSISTLSLIMLVAIIFFFLVEKYFHWHHCHCDDPAHTHAKKPLGYINLVGDGIHNFVDGILIATSFMINPSLGIVTTVVIALHEIPQEIADFGVLIYSGFSKVKALWWNFASAMTAVAGGILAYLLGTTIVTIVPIFLSVAAGSFLYLAMADIIPELHHETDRKQVALQTVWLIAGVILIVGIGMLLPETH